MFENIDLATVRGYIDWTPFFSTWMLQGKFPQILENPTVGVEATKLYEEANALLDNLIANQTITAKAIIGIFKAASQGDDVLLENGTVVHFLRQQGQKGSGIQNLSLADWIAPMVSGKEDYLGMFAVSAGFGVEELTKQLEQQHDDYQSIMVKSVADRLAEALAEYMHEQVRKTLWGYAEHESLDNESLIKEKYQGIRPAPGYPACPDHTEKATIWQLLKVEEIIGIKLTESFAMYPASSVSGYYFSHPDARYFGLGKIYQDQVQDYARRKNESKATIEQWLAPNLGY